MRTITLCSGKGGVGKTLLATTLGRIIQRDENCKVLLVDLDLSVRGLTLLAFQNKYQLDQLPLSLTEYLANGQDDTPALFDELRRGLSINGSGDDEEAVDRSDDGLPNHSASRAGIRAASQAGIRAASQAGGQSTYQRLNGLFILPSSTESERPDWMQFSHLELDEAVDKLGRLHQFVAESLDVGYLIFDTQAGLGSLSLAAATLSDLNLVVLEEDDISWRTALSMLMEISELNKRLQHKSRSYFLANKVSTGMLDASDKLKAFSFLPPVPFDTWMQKLFAHDTAAVLEKDFEGSDFFRQVESRVWRELAVILGIRQRSDRSGAKTAWWRG